MRIDEAGKENRAVAVDVDSTVRISADAVTINEDGSGWEKTMAIKYAHIINGSFVMGGHIMGWRSPKGSYARQIRRERHDAEEMTSSKSRKYNDGQLQLYTEKWFNRGRALKVLYLHMLARACIGSSSASSASHCTAYGAHGRRRDEIGCTLRYSAE